MTTRHKAEITLENLSDCIMKKMKKIDRVNEENDEDGEHQHSNSNEENEEELNEMRHRAGLDVVKLHGEPDSELKAFLSMAGL